MAGSQKEGPSFLLILYDIYCLFVCFFGLINMMLVHCRKYREVMSQFKFGFFLKFLMEPLYVNL